MEPIRPRKTKKIIFRVPAELKTFIDNLARANGMTTSEFMRRIVIYFNMAYILGKLNTPYNELKEEFFKRLDELNKGESDL